MTGINARRTGDNDAGSGWTAQRGRGVTARSSTTRGWRPLAVGAVAASTTLLGMASAGAASAAPAAACTPNVGGTGLSAAVVATSHQTIAHRTIRAGRCDIGIYVGAGASWVRINDVTVTGAHFQGIFAEKTAWLSIENSTVRNNGFKTIDPTAPPLPGSGVHSRVSQSFAISLFGVSNSTVRGNRVADNGRGGIGIMDNGPNDPGAITQDTSAPLVSSSHDSVVGNTMSANYSGCALVAATQNVGGSLSDLILSGNTVRGTGISAKGADVGGIVVAADLPGSTVTTAIVNRNTVRNSIEGGVIVNAEAPASSTRNVWVTNNTLVGNNIGHAEAPETAGIIVNAADPAARNLSTVVVHNTVTKQFYGIWSMGSYAPVTFANHIKVTAGGTPIYHG